MQAKTIAWILLILLIIVLISLILVQNMIEGDSVAQNSNTKMILIDGNDTQESAGSVKIIVKPGQVQENQTEDEDTAAEEDDVQKETEKAENKTSEKMDTLPPAYIDEDTPPAEQFLEDWNKDGIMDLVRKEADGKFYVFINYGTNASPVYNESYAYKK
jgi:hypothetical protein